MNMNRMHLFVGLICLTSATFEPTIWQRAILIGIGALNIFFANQEKSE